MKSHRATQTDATIGSDHQPETPNKITPGLAVKSSVKKIQTIDLASEPTSTSTSSSTSHPFRPKMTRKRSDLSYWPSNTLIPKIYLKFNLGANIYMSRL